VLPLPTVTELAEFTGRPEASYSSYATACIMQAALMLTFHTELTPNDWPNLGGIVGNGMTTEDCQQLATNGILAMADYLFLRQPFQQVIASPLMNETIGSYSYGKAEAEVARNAAALEVTGERTNVVFYDMAVQYLAKRQIAGGVFSGAITVFEDDSFRYDNAALEIREQDGRMVLLGPAMREQFDIPFSISSPVFPSDPGI
jgi:hypothetical protein